MPTTAAVRPEHLPFRLPPAVPARVPHTVVVLHGFTSGPHSVRAWAEGLAAGGSEVVVPLLPGHGTDWRDLAATSAHALRSAVRAVVDAELARGVPVVVAGLSMGGALALDAAAHRRVAAVLVVNPALRFASALAPAAPLLRHVVPTVAPIANDVADPAADELAYPRTPVAGVAALGAIQRAARHGLGRITAPVTVFRSAQDAVVPAASHRTLLRGLRRAPVEVVGLPRSRHVATMDLDLALLVARSRAAVDAALGAAARA